MKITQVLSMAICLIAFLVLPIPANAMQPALVTVHIRVKQPETGASLPGSRVRVVYWHCILFACAIKPLGEGTTGATGEATLVVEKRKSMMVQDLACPGENTMLGVRIPRDDLKNSEVTVDITATQSVCRAPRTSHAP